jgi:hypothetical protein
MFLVYVVKVLQISTKDPGSGGNIRGNTVGQTVGRFLKKFFPALQFLSFSFEQLNNL